MKTTCGGQRMDNSVFYPPTRQVCYEFADHRGIGFVGIGGSPDQELSFRVEPSPTAPPGAPFIIFRYSRQFPCHFIIIHVYGKHDQKKSVKNPRTRPCRRVTSRYAEDVANSRNTNAIFSRRIWQLSINLDTLLNQSNAFQVNLNIFRVKTSFLQIKLEFLKGLKQFLVKRKF